MQRRKKKGENLFMFPMIVTEEHEMKLDPKISLGVRGRIFIPAGNENEVIL